MEIGPRIVPYFGFDLLMYETCIEFGMESCRPLVMSKSSTRILYEHLELMHSLQLFHLDIKP